MSTRKLKWSYCAAATVVVVAALSPCVASAVIGATLFGSTYAGTQGKARFLVSTDLKGEAVLDQETGLAWERSPSTPPIPWADARMACANKTTAGRMGWRMPTNFEMLSLFDPTVAEAPYLPTGHPFMNVQVGNYWSATTDAGDATKAWRVQLRLHPGNIFDIPAGKSESAYVWCVRGPMNSDAQ